MKQSYLELLAKTLLSEIGVFEEEYKFHPQRKWRFDFANIERKIAVEIEGGVYSGGRHTRGSGFEKDAEKYNESAIMGWRVFRFTGGMINKGDLTDVIKRAFL